MKLSKESITILKNFSTINPSIMLKPGTFIMTKSINGVSYAEATLPDEITEEMGIYELGAFLNIHNQFGEDSEITTNDTGDIVISNKRAKVNISSSDASMIVTPLQRIKFPVANVIFDLKTADLQDINKVARLVGADVISITTREGRLFIDALNTNDNSAIPRYSLDIGEYEGGNTFSFVINLNNMKLIDDDYKVMVAAVGAVKFEGNHATYVVALEKASSHNFS